MVALDSSSTLLDNSAKTETSAFQSPTLQSLIKFRFAMIFLGMIVHKIERSTNNECETPIVSPDKELRNLAGVPVGVSDRGVVPLPEYKREVDHGEGGSSQRNLILIIMDAFTTTKFEDIIVDSPVDMEGSGSGGGAYCVVA
ncbi:hypothetical protein ONZ45_g18962 [Pleurotus djamor]|nr:hypothetical protein ONZ45_g18962 [Pleurotus djamor]